MTYDRPGLLRARQVVGLAVVVLVVGSMVTPSVPPARSPELTARLPQIGPAPVFVLTNERNRRMALVDLRGKVTVVTFIFAGCSDICPLLTSKLAEIQRRLGERVDDVRFAAITVDPLNDTPAVLTAYGKAHGVDPNRFTFLTGSVQEIDAVARAYAVFRKPAPGGRAIDHTFLTSLVDRQGVLRVQYIGVRFDPQEFLRDLTSLMNERGPP